MAMKKMPTRQCVGCREIKPKKELIRIIRSDDGQISVDSSGKKNGRGAYICPNEECLKLALKNKGLEKSLKTAIPTDIYDEFKKEMSDFESK